MFGEPSSASTKSEHVVRAFSLLKLDPVEYPALFALVCATLRDNPIEFSPDHLRKGGDLLTKDELRAAGMRGNVKMSRAFYKALPDPLQAAPVEAAFRIVKLVNESRYQRRSLDQALGILGPDDRVQFRPNNMAAGPCSACIALSREPIRLSQIPDIPLLECPHPDQCALHWSPILDAEAEEQAYRGARASNRTPGRAGFLAGLWSALTGRG